MSPQAKFGVPTFFPLIETQQICLISLNKFQLLGMKSNRKSSLPRKRD